MNPSTSSVVNHSCNDALIAFADLIAQMKEEISNFKGSEKIKTEKARRIKTLENIFLVFNQFHDPDLWLRISQTVMNSFHCDSNLNGAVVIFKWTKGEQKYCRIEEDLSGITTS